MKSVSSDATPNEQIGDFNEILHEVGPRGWFQLKNIVLLWSSSAALGLSALLFAFVALVPKYRCPVTECSEGPGSPYYGNQDNQTLPNFLLDAFAPEDIGDRISKCKQYKFLDESDPLTCFDYVDRLRNNLSEANLTYCAKEDLIIDKTYARTTLTVDFGFVCEYEFLRDFYNATYMVGMLFGAFIFGIVSDRWGRLNALLSAATLLFVCGTLAAFVTIPELYGVLRFLIGMAGIGSYMSGYLLGLENTTPKYSVQVGMALSLGFVWGALLLSLIVFLIRDWTTLHLVATAPIFLMIFLKWLVPESPRWLIARGRIAEAKVIINSIADFNGRPHPNHLYKLEQKKKVKSLEIQEDTEALTIGVLIKSKSLFFRTAALSMQWASVTMAYYGITFALTSFAGDPYLNFVLGILSEIPSTAYVFLTLDFFGRRFMTVKLQILAGVSCILAGFCMEYKEFKSFQIVFAMIGKFSATCLFAVVYLYSAELYPTGIRNQAMGICSTVARLGGLLALLLGALRSFWPPFPMLIMGSIATVAGLVALTLPETTGIPLPETKQDAVAIRKRGGDFKLFGCNNGHD